MHLLAIFIHRSVIKMQIKRHLALLTIALGALFFFPRASWAYKVTGRDIYEGCKSFATGQVNWGKLESGQEIYIGHCGGLITAYMELIRVYKGTTAPQIACIPKTTTVSEVAKKVVKFLDTNRSHWNMSASTLVLVAIKNGYVCGRK